MMTLKTACTTIIGFYLADQFETWAYSWATMAELYTVGGLGALGLGIGIYSAAMIEHAR